VPLWYHFSEYHNAQCPLLFVIMPSIILLGVIVLGNVKLSFVLLSVIVLNVVAPSKEFFFFKIEFLLFVPFYLTPPPFFPFFQQKGELYYKTFFTLE
jgi:hypothetical protein